MGIVIPMSSETDEASIALLTFDVMFVRMRIIRTGALILGLVACDGEHEETSSGQAEINSSGCATQLQNVLEAPIVPPGPLAGLTFDQAETKLCKATPVGPSADPDKLFASWGVGGPIVVEYLTTEPKTIDYVALGRGYRGKLEFRSRAGGKFGAHEYVVEIGTPILRDGVAFTLDAANSLELEQRATELHDGLLATFAPSLPSEGVACSASDDCLVHDSQDDVQLGSTALAMQLSFTKGALSTVYFYPTRASITVAAEAP